MNFAEIILSEKDFVKKLEIVSLFQKKEKVFFDTSVVFKAEVAKQFIETMRIDVDENIVLTACMVYSFKRLQSPAELGRIKNEWQNDYKYFKSLGFDDRFCKICSEYCRHIETEDIEREKEGDILELVENFGGLVMYREDRLAYPVDEALDIMECKNLYGKNNRYLPQFKQFVEIMEDIEV